MYTCFMNIRPKDRLSKSTIELKTYLE